LETSSGGRQLIITWARIARTLPSVIAELTNASPIGSGPLFVKWEIDWVWLTSRVCAQHYQFGNFAPGEHGPNQIGDRLGLHLRSSEAKIRAKKERETGAHMWIDRSTVQNTALFIVVILITYFVGMMCWPSPPRRLPAPAGAAPHTTAVPQPAADTPSVAEKPRALTTEEIAGRCENAVAFVSGRHSAGTAFLVRSRLLATNAHVLCVERIEDLLVTFPDARIGSMTPELIFEDPRRDLALLAVPTDLAPLEIESDYHFRRGQEVTVIGNPGISDKLILKNAVSRGVVSTEAVIDRQNFYQLNISINHGNSGGPTIDSSGKVIGVATLGTHLEGIAFCIPAADLLSAIAQAESLTTDKNAILSLHRARYVAAYLAGIGYVYSDALGKAVTAMDLALTNRLDPNLAISLVQREVTGKLQKSKAFFINVFDQEFDRVCTDVRIAESVRNELRSFSDSCLAMIAALNAPEGSADTYRSRVSLLQEKHRWYIERLEAELVTKNRQ